MSLKQLIDELTLVLNKGTHPTTETNVSSIVVNPTDIYLEQSYKYQPDVVEDKYRSGFNRGRAKGYTEGYNAALDEVSRKLTELTDNTQ